MECFFQEKIYLCIRFATIAQLVEHWLPKPRVASSSLVYRSKEKQSLHIGIANITFTTIKQCFFDNSCRTPHCPEAGMSQNGNSPDAPHKTSRRINATAFAQSDNGARTSPATCHNSAKRMPLRQCNDSETPRIHCRHDAGRMAMAHQANRPATANHMQHHGWMA